MSDQNDQGGAGGVGGGLKGMGGTAGRGFVVLFVASMVRTWVAHLIAKWAPELLGMPEAKAGIEWVSFAVAAAAVAWLSTKSRQKGEAAAAGMVAGMAAEVGGSLMLTDEDEAGLEAAFARAKMAGLTGSRVGSAGAGDGWGESSARAEIPPGGGGPA